MQTKKHLGHRHQVPQGKQTSLGLYVTAAEAYEMWKADPERVKVLDVRMVEEYVFLGHAEDGGQHPGGLSQIPMARRQGGSMALRSTPISSTM